MNPVWAIFFKDRFKTPFSVYRMSFAELVFLLTIVGGIGYGCVKAAKWIVEVETNATVVEETE